MNFNDNKYLFFYVKNHTGMYTTTGYTLCCTPFTFIPVLDTGDDEPVSTTRLLWDFGDGTTSRDITATHQFTIPGTYNVTCYMYSSGGQGYESSFTQNIFVKDYISDTLVVNACRVPVIEAGHLESPFTVSRFNSWQTYPSLSTQGATIMLFASGSNSPTLNLEEYSLDKYAHLKPSSRFVVSEYNVGIDDYEMMSVESIKTIDNKDIYVKLDSNSEVEVCDSTDLGATLAGTSGSRVVYYVDDVVRVTEDNAFPRATLVLAFFDTTDFYDNNSYDKNLTKSKYPILRQVIDNSFTPVIVHQSGLSGLSITSNGIDVEGVSGVSSNFDIAVNKFVGQKIPFVVKVKDAKNYSVKSIPTLTSVSTQNNINPFEVKLSLKDNYGGDITDGIIFQQDFNVLSGTAAGGVCMGYLSANTAYSNVTICAEAYISGGNYYNVPTAHACIPHPQSKQVHIIDIFQPFDEIRIAAEDSLLNTITLTGIYTTAVIPTRSAETSCVDYYIWVADADQDKIVKYNLNAEMLQECSLPQGSSPSQLVVDGDENVWVALYDSVSVVKIDGNTGSILARAIPPAPYTNRDYISAAYYTPLSGHAGSNSILPASVDVDRENNLWVSYNFPLSGLICKYSKTGSIINTIPVRDYTPGEILARSDDMAWAICKRRSSTALGNNDALGLVTSNAVLPITAGHSLWNITHDTQGNIWVTADRSNVIKFDSNGFIKDTFTLPSKNIDYDVCELGGIGCTTSNTIMVLSESNKCLYYFNVEDAIDGTITNLNSAALVTPSDITSNSTQDMINAYGDWTGLRFINRFRNNTINGSVSGCSSTFNIHPADGVYSIAKVNENFNAAAQYNSFLFQESLNEYTKMFKDFFGAAIGDGDSLPTAIGKRIYEKIANFCDNISYVDTCNIEALKSLHEELNEEFITLKEGNFNYPANISRLMDIFSIKLSKLRGSRNQFAENFDDKGFSKNNKYGKNKGDLIDISTAILQGGVDGRIIAHEKFSDTYSLINTNLPQATFIPYIDTLKQTYALSSYDARWGWGLVLPDDYISSDLKKYYNFYEYLPGVEGSQIEGVINWSDPSTSIPEYVKTPDEWSSIIENMLTYTLAEGLEILSATK